MTGGIYCILNTESDTIYIGSTKAFPFRWATHLKQLRQGSHHNPNLQAAWDEYGEETFVFEVLEEVEKPASLTQREQYWVDLFLAQETPLYNAMLIVSRPDDTERHDLAQKSAVRERRALELAELDLQMKRTPDVEIAEQMGVSRRTVCRIRKTEEYQAIVAELTKPDEHYVNRVTVKAQELLTGTLAHIEQTLKRDDLQLRDLIPLLKYFSRILDLQQAEPGTQLALPAQDFHPATVLIQNAYFGQQQGEVVESEVKVLAPAGD